MRIYRCKACEGFSYLQCFRLLCLVTKIRSSKMTPIEDDVKYLISHLLHVILSEEGLDMETRKGKEDKATMVM